jgi:hypothetical protein
MFFLVVEQFAVVLESGIFSSMLPSHDYGELTGTTIRVCGRGSEGSMFLDKCMASLF